MWYVGEAQKTGASSECDYFWKKKQKVTKIAWSDLWREVRVVGFLLDNQLLTAVQNCYLIPAKY